MLETVWGTKGDPGVWGDILVFRIYHVRCWEGGIGTCLRELNSSTNTCRTSLDLRQMLFKCGILIVQGFIDFHTHTIKDGSWGNPTGDMPWHADGGWIYAMVQMGVSPSDSATYFGISSEASKWGADNCTPVEAASGERLAWYLSYGWWCSYDDEHLGQEGMSYEQLYAVLRQVREKIAPILTMRRQRPHAE